MKTRFIDYQATQTRNRFNLAAARRITQSPTRLRLASIRINTGNLSQGKESKVELVATVGVRGVTGIAQLLFRIFRDGREIYNTQQGVESTGSEQNYAVSFQAIDRNLTGFHTYILTVENRTAGTVAQVVGPLNFSGLSTRES